MLLHWLQKYNVSAQKLNAFVSIQCVGQVYTVCVSLEDQFYRYMMHVQWTNPMGQWECTKGP